MFSRFFHRRGFTLIELMIVVVIASILAALAIPRFLATSGKSRKAEAKTILKQIMQLERAYFQEHDSFVAAANKAALVASSLGFEDPGADTRYDYAVTVAGNTFTVTATELADADLDGTANEQLTMNEDGDEAGDW